MTDTSAGESLAPASQDTTVTITRLVSSPVKEVWRMLNTPAGAEAILGEGAQIGDKGDSWHANDGTYGVVRSYHPLEQIRFSWHETDDAPKTLVDLHLIPAGDATNVEIRHEHVPATTDTQTIVRRWESALDRFFSLS